MSVNGTDGVRSYGESLRRKSGPVYLLEPGEQALETTIGAARAGETPEIRVIETGRRLRAFRSRFRAAARAADLVAEGRLAFRSTEETTGTPALVGPEAVDAPVIVGSGRTIVEGRDRSFAEQAYAHCEERWAETAEFSLHTPPLSAVRETMAAEFGDRARERFDEALSTVERGDQTAFDEVYAVLLIAGCEELLHYDLSKWGEDIGLASKATFSRKKKELEELGVVETEKVSIEVGRPRQRLLITDEYRERLAEDGIAGVIAGLA